MSEQAYALIVAEMPEVERLALLSVRDGGPISDALLSTWPADPALFREVKRTQAVNDPAHVTPGKESA